MVAKGGRMVPGGQGPPRGPRAGRGRRGGRLHRAGHARPLPRPRVVLARVRPHAALRRRDVGLQPVPDARPAARAVHLVQPRRRAQPRVGTAAGRAGAGAGVLRPRQAAARPGEVRRGGRKLGLAPDEARRQRPASSWAMSGRNSTSSTRIGAHDRLARCTKKSACAAARPVLTRPRGSRQARRARPRPARPPTSASGATATWCSRPVGQPQEARGTSARATTGFARLYRDQALRRAAPWARWPRPRSIRRRGSGRSWTTAPAATW